MDCSYSFYPAFQLSSKLQRASQGVRISSTSVRSVKFGSFLPLSNLRSCIVIPPSCTLLTMHILYILHLCIHTYSQVCGTDMVTYNHICVLRSMSSNARPDYEGECMGEEGDSFEDICNRVSEKGVCRYNSNNCKKLVLPNDGCCPVCGTYAYI